MARDATLLTERNKKIRAEFNRLKGEERPCTFRGETFYIRLSSDQAVKILSARYHLSMKQVENVLYATEPKPVPISKAAA